MPADTRFPVRVCKTIRATRARPGDRVVLETIEPVLLANGIVIPEDARLTGEVAFVRSDHKAEPQSWVRLWVTRLRWKAGQANLNAVVDAVYYVPTNYIFPFSRVERKATFLEGIHVSPHFFKNGSTDFFSDSREVVLRKGILLEMRQVVPSDEDPSTLSVSTAVPRN
ncbi:MAG TPA: hypothetical protein VFU86_07805 [Terriglobales bacterium]|nr:hypothetical protein [Terriglobales bacterium]